MRDQGRDREFTDYVMTNRVRLLRTARLLTTGDNQGAEDLVQTTLTRLYVHWAKVRKARDPAAYGLKTLSNAFFDERRRARNRHEVLAPSAPDAGQDDIGPELRQSVLGALAELPPRQRAVVVLRHWLDLDVPTTAELLGCTAGTVKSQNSKALDHLRTTLDLDVLNEGNPR